ncbi:MAG: zinc-binding dehydrogenase [Dehalococcoidia bacterium]
MQACVKTGMGQLEMIDIPMPEPGEGEIVVKTTLCTVCGSDMHFVDEFPDAILAGLDPGSQLEQGFLMGHEGVGVVHSVGAGVTRFKEGDRVMSSCLTGCGKCHECMTVDHSVCTGGGHVIFGCQAEYYKIPFAELNAARVPDGVDDQHALLATDIMSTGFGAIERANARFGDSVAIFAQGPLGLCATAGARARGCGLIIAVDTLPDRLEISRKLGANVTINAKEKDPVAEIMALTGQQGVDIAVEAVGTQPTFEACTRVVRRGGTVSSIGVYGLTPALSMPTLSVSFLHRNIITTLCPSGSDRMEHLLGLLASGSVDLSALFTHSMNLADTPKAYELFRSKTEGVLKIAVTP